MATRSQGKKKSLTQGGMHDWNKIRSRPLNTLDGQHKLLCTKSCYWSVNLLTSLTWSSSCLKINDCNNPWLIVTEEARPSWLLQEKERKHNQVRSLCHKLRKDLWLVHTKAIPMVTKVQHLVQGFHEVSSNIWGCVYIGGILGKDSPKFNIPSSAVPRCLCCAQRSSIKCEKGPHAYLEEV